MISLHWLTYQTVVHQFKYFLPECVHHTLSRRQLKAILYVTNVVFGMFLTSELVYALWEEVPKLVYYRLICKPVYGKLNIPYRKLCRILVLYNLLKLWPCKCKRTQVKFSSGKHTEERSSFTHFNITDCKARGRLFSMGAYFPVNSVYGKEEENRTSCMAFHIII